MNIPLITIHNVETNEIVQREMTTEELAQRQTDQENEIKFLTEQNKVKKLAESAKDAAQAKLAALGLTADDLKALGL